MIFYSIQTNGGTQFIKYYLSLGTSLTGVAYTLQVNVSNNGPSSVAVSSNFNSVTVFPGVIQDIILNFTGDGTSPIKFSFAAVTGVSDSLDIVVSDPLVAKVSDNINLISPSQLDFSGWTVNSGATVTVDLAPTPIPGPLPPIPAPPPSSSAIVYDAYTGLVTSEHNQRPKFMAMLNVLTQFFIDYQLQMSIIPVLFDYNTATGDQLDKLGAWIGASRSIVVAGQPGSKRIQSAGGSLSIKYVTGTAAATNGVVYTSQVSIQNNGNNSISVGSNYVNVNVPAHSIQRVTLTYTGNGVSDAQIIFGTVSGPSDFMDIVVWDPYIAVVSTGVNLLTSQLDFVTGWSALGGASITVTDASVPATVVLSDDGYRLLLSATIAANHWDGTIPDMYAVFNDEFAQFGLSLLLRDNQDGSITPIIASSGPIDPVAVSLIKNGNIVMRPAGVRITNYYNAASLPVFGFGLSTASIAGWGIGSWVTPL